MTDRPCDGIRVLDLSSGPVGGVPTMVLADFGADVIKVEPPGGDPFRGQAASATWLRGKRSLVLDLCDAAARNRLHALTEGADVVVVSYAPGEAEPLGADAATLRALNPRLVYCSITGWGPRGRYAQYPAIEHIVAAKAGRMRSINAFPPREMPYFTPVRVASHAAAQSALAGILAALFVREATGAGQVVETSLLQGMFAFDLADLLRTQLMRRYPEQFGTAFAMGRNTLQYIPALASDGRWIQFANLMEHLFHSMINAIGLDEIYSDPRFMNAPETASDEDRNALRLLILERVLTRPSHEWMELFRADGNVAAEPFTTTQEALSHPDLVANDEVVEVEHPRLGRMRQHGLLARLYGTPGRLDGLGPAVGEHTRAILEEQVAALAARRGEEGAGATGAPAHPLSGITVVEFATVIAVPLGASFLADLGARVIKVEPLEGDPYRGMGAGLAGYFGTAKTTAGKESICLDLKTEEGQRIAQALVSKADAIIHNYRPGVPERLGIGYEQLRALRPDLVYVSANGYGPKGPGARRPAAHPIPGAVLGGALQQAGAGGAPSHCDTAEDLLSESYWLYAANESSPDPITAVVVASATLLGLLARRRTGRGQAINLSMLGAASYANFDDFVSYEGKPPRPPVDQDLYGLNALYRLYPARAGVVFLAVSSDQEWQQLCVTAGCDELLADPRFATEESRGKHQHELADSLGALFARRDAAEWEEMLITAGVPCVRADEHTPGSFYVDDDHMRANGFVLEADHALWGRHQRWGPMVTFSATPGRYGPGVLAGEQTDALLAELGYSAEGIADLRARRVVSSIPPIRLG